jgi:hypothetical protein
LIPSALTPESIRDKIYKILAYYINHIGIITLMVLHTPDQFPGAAIRIKNTVQTLLFHGGITGILISGFPHQLTFYGTA